MPALPPVLPARPPRASTEPRLKGMLAIIFWCACGVTAVNLAGPFALIAQIGPHATFNAVIDALSGDSVQSRILRFGLFPQLVLFVWAASFVVLTVMRRQSALLVSRALMLAWLLISAVCQFGIRDAIAPGGMTMEAFAALIPGILAQGVGVAAFWAFMRDGAQPRAYFVR
ncbi:hypothetical protein [Aquabacter spiritensis]|uniref:DUF2569 domain-containing protein n=1 Tax=Aquabacter spiritensis TaxID=933073 RepID=A0A4R3LSC3_9HYPH|nr:hypothetical protein [Aquabacter spiritensis]TCT03454.1 hypothetical protein EDC64_1094 [Aquabacter spiritensis]